MSDRIQDAQKRLGQAMRRARVAEAKEMAKLVREQAERLAHVQYGLLQLARIHEVNNSAFDVPIEEFRSVLRMLIDLLGPVHLVCVEDQFYLNDIRVRFDSNPEHAVAFEQMLSRHNVGGVTYYDDLDDEQLRAAVALFTAAADPERPRGALQDKLAEAGLSSVELHPLFHYRTDAEPADREIAEIYEATVGVVTETYANLGANRLPNPLPVRRIVNDLVDATESHDLAQQALRADETAPPFARHTLMVTNLALLIGRAAGLPDRSLADLGVAAMLHDIGLSGQGEESVPFASHPRAGLRILLRQKGFHEARVQRMLTVLEHHRSYDDPNGRPSLHARIVHIADDYDILTRNRPRRGPIAAPPDAMRLLAGNGGSVYDPVLLQLFINAMGAYPAGSIMRMSDGRIVVSVSGVRSTETFAKPLCKVIRNPDGSAPDKETHVDLAREGRVAGILRPRSAAADS